MFPLLCHHLRPPMPLQILMGRNDSSLPPHYNASYPRGQGICGYYLPTSQNSVQYILGTL